MLTLLTPPHSSHPHTPHTLTLFTPPHTATLDSSLLPLKAQSVTSPASGPPALEVREFPPLEHYHPHPYYQPALSFQHHLFVYPIQLKYDSQKVFAKVRVHALLYTLATGSHD